MKIDPIKQKEVETNQRLLDELLGREPWQLKSGDVRLSHLILPFAFQHHFREFPAISG